MSQALRKLAGALNQTKTTAIFINQLREKVGVMFGCMSYSTRVTLADGTQEKIGKIVNQRMDVEVLSYDPEADRVVPARIVNWFNNGRAERFLQFTVAKSGKNGRAQFAATENHLIRTPGGWRPAGELIPGDRVIVAEQQLLGAQQVQVILGSLMGDGALSPNLRGRSGTRFRMGHGAKQAAYLDWKVSLLENIPHTRTSNAKGAVFADFTPLPELAELRDIVYFGDGKKHLTWDYLKGLTPLALAVWYMDDGCFTVRSKGVQERTRGGTGRIEICVEAMSPGSRDRLASYLRDALPAGREAHLPGGAEDQRSPVHHRGVGEVPGARRALRPPIDGLQAAAAVPGQVRRPAGVRSGADPARPCQVLDIHVKPPTRSMSRFDIEVEGSHCYFVDGVMVHNSPETTSGGRALKFYASVRLDVRRIETLKDGTEAVGNRTKVKVVKNKVAPPFKTAEFDILFGIGISREGGLIDLGVEQNIVRKSGAWYTYEGDQLGQGKENARNFLRDNPDLANEIEKKIKEKLGVGPRLDAEAAGQGQGAGVGRGPARGPERGRGTRLRRRVRPAAGVSPGSPEGPVVRGSSGGRGIGASPGQGGRRARGGSSGRKRGTGHLTLVPIQIPGWCRVPTSMPARALPSRVPPRQIPARSPAVRASAAAVAAAVPGTPAARTAGPRPGPSGTAAERVRRGAGVLARTWPRARRWPATRTLAARRRRGRSACGCSPPGRAPGRSWPLRCASGRIPDEVAESVLSRFAEVGLIDDAAFARAWVESRHHSRGLARRALTAELRQRGIPDGEVRSAVGLLGPQDELATARRLVAKRAPATRGKPMPARARQLMGMLARKGYPAGLAAQVVREALEQEQQDSRRGASGRIWRGLARTAPVTIGCERGTVR